MECLRCKFYKSGYMSNSCDLFGAENFMTFTKEKPCRIVSDNYIAEKDCEPFGIKKGDNLLESINQLVSTLRRKK